MGNESDFDKMKEMLTSAGIPFKGVPFKWRERRSKSALVRHKSYKDNTLTVIEVMEQEKYAQRALELAFDSSGALKDIEPIAWE